MKRKVVAWMQFPAQNYREWSKEQLIERIRLLEGAEEVRPQRRRPERPFEYSLYPKQHVALKIAYFGWEYNGFASQRSYKVASAGPTEEGGESSPPRMSSVVTVEDVIFDALLRTRLIESPRSCRYSRCGRTDAGVSSVGQVVALTLRCSARKQGGVADGDRTEEQPFSSVPLMSMLNRNLPREVRVLGWCPVGEDFDARFSCRGRRYLYFFSGLGLDVDRMRQAAAKLVGEHDFCNFARRDPNRPDQSTVRRVISTAIRAREDAPGMFEFEIHGSAFLYHQVRCTMQILLLVGRGLEPVEVVDYLLDVEKCPTPPPQYGMASEIPLVLAECYYDEPLAFRSGEAAEALRLNADIFQLWRDQQVKAMTVDLLRNIQEDPIVPFLGTPFSSHIMTPKRRNL